MEGFNFNKLATALSDTKESGVSFVGKAKVWGTEEEAVEVIEAINNCKKLEFLNLEGNTLGVEAANGIAKALESHPEFKHALWKDLFTGRLKHEIPLALESMGKGMITAGAKLAILDCSDNALGPNGMKGLVDLLKSPTCYSLQELKLNNCGLGIEGGRMLAKSLTECLASSKKAGTIFQLKVFIAGRNRLENDGARALGAIFGDIGTLEEITMPQNGINHDGIHALSEGFKTNTKLKVINLNDNTIGRKGASAIAEALEYLQGLEELNFGDCLLKTGGAILLSEALQDGHSQLETFNLGFNEIGPNGAFSVATAMQNKPYINNVILNGNMFGSECRESIQQMFADFNKLDALGELDEDDSDNEEADHDLVHDDGEEDDCDGEEDETDLDGEEDDDEDDEDDDDEEDDGEYGESDTDDIIAATDLTVGNNNNSTLDFSLSQSSFNQNFSLPNINGSGIGANDNTTKQLTTVSTFCWSQNPSTVAMFNGIEESDKIFAFRNYLGGINESDYLVCIVFSILKLSALSNQSKDALNVAEALYKDCFEYAKSTNQISRVVNFFLIQLGWLKSEDKSFKPIYDLNACRSALSYVIQTKTLPNDVTSTFEFFLKEFKV